MSNHDHHLSDSSQTPGSSQPTFESLEPRLLLSIALQNLLPTAPLRPVLDHLADQLEKLLPDEIRDAVMPGINALMQSGNSNYIYLALPNETNDVKVWGELGNELLLTNESKDVTIFRLGTFSFEPVEKIEVNPKGKVEAGGSFVAHLAGGIGLKLDGFFQSVAKQWFSLSSPRVVALNGMALISLIPQAADLLNVFESFLDFSISDVIPNEVTVIPPIYLFGKKVWGGWTVPVPSFLNNIPTVGDLIGVAVPKGVQEVFDWITEITTILQTTLLTDGVYVGTLDGNDTIDLSELTGIPQTVHGDAGNDVIYSGGGQDLLDAIGVPFRGDRGSREIWLFGDDGNDTFVVNRLYDSENCRIEGGPGSDRLVIEADPGSDIIRLIAGEDGQLHEIRFEIANPLAGVPTNEVQRITWPDGVNGGTFWLGVDGWGETWLLDWDASPAEVEQALADLAGAGDPPYGLDDIEVTGSPGDWEIEFRADLGGQNFAPLIVHGQALTRRVTAAVVSTEREGGDGGGQAIANEIQQITLPDGVSGGTFTLRFDAHAETGPIPYNAGANDIEEALLLTGMSRADFDVTGPYGGPWRVEFTGDLAMTDVPQIVADGSGLWGGLDNWDLVETRAGKDPVFQKQLVALPDEANGGTFKLTFDDGRTRRTTAAIAYDATTTEVRDALADLGNIGGIENVAVEYGPGPWTWVVEFTGDLGGQGYPLFEIDAGAVTYSGPGIGVTTDADGAIVNEQQIVSLSPATATGGTFRLSFNGSTTAPLAYDASAASVEDALELLPTIGANNVSVTGPDGGAWTVEFIGALAGQDVDALAVSAVGLTGPDAPYTGGSGTPVQGQTIGERQTVTASSPSAAPFTLTFMGETTDPIPIDASAAAVQNALAALSTVGLGNVSVTGAAGGAWTVEFVGALAGQDQAEMTGEVVPGVAQTEPAEAGVDEIQTLVIPAAVSGGHLQLIVRTRWGTTSTVVPYDATAAELQEALEDMQIVGAGNVEVQLVSPSPRTFEITFVNDLGGQAVDAITVDTRFLSGGGVVDVEELSPLVVNEIQRVHVPYPNAQVGTFQLELPGHGQTGDIDLQASVADFTAALEAAFGAGNVDVVEGANGNGWEVQFVGALGGQDLPEMIVHGGQVDVKGVEVEVEELTAGNNGENTTVLATTRFLELKDVEKLEISGGSGNDTLILDCTEGPIYFRDGIHYDGGAGLNRIFIEGSEDNPAVSVQERSGVSLATWGEAPADQQLLTYSSSRVYDFLPAGKMVVRGGPESDFFQVTSDEYEGATVGFIRVDNGPSRLYYANKDSLVLQTGGGDDAISFELAALPARVTAVTIDGEASVGGDELLLIGTGQDDLFRLTPTSAKGGSLVVNTGGDDVLFELAGLEALSINGMEPAASDRLIVTAPNATVEPGDFPGTGEVIARSAAGLPRLSVAYVGVEDVQVRALDVLAFEGSAGDDVVRVTASQVIFVDIFGHENVTDVGATPVVWLHLMDGNDSVTVEAATPLPFQLEILGGGSDPGGDELSYSGAGGDLDFDWDDQSLAEDGGSVVTFYGMETFDLDALGAGLAVATGPDDETVVATPLDGNSGRLSVVNWSLMVRYAGLGGMPVGVDLAEGEDTLIVNGSAVGDEVTVDAGGVTFTDDGRALTYAGTEALTINALQGDDHLDVDNSAGLLDLPGGVYYDGGTGSDWLRLIGPTAVDEAFYKGGPGFGKGVLRHVLSAAEQTVTFENLERVLDIVPGSLIVEGTGGSDIITCVLGPNSGAALVAGLDSAQVAVGYDQPLEFAAKSAVTFSGLGGHDTIDLTDAPLPAELVARILDGGPGNDILIGSAGSDQLLGGRGDDLLRGEGGDDLLSGGEGADVLLGGAGDDTAEFLGTAGDDAIEVADETLVLNGVTDEFAEIETLAVHALAGHDDVFVEAGADFAAFADIMTGDGDDNIHVLLHNPAPATSILVDGGAPQASDTATVEGMTGNDQFTEYGWVNVFGAATVTLLDIENPLILEGRRIDRDRYTVEADRFVFGDADGNPAMVTMAGPGSVDVLRNIFSGRSADIHRLVLIGTDPQRTRVNVRVYRAAGTDNETSIGSITGAGTGARAIVARDSDLVGAGIELSGLAGELRFDDIRDGADIRLGGESGQKLRLFADEVGHVELITGAVVSAEVTRWDGGLIQGSVLNRIRAKNGSFGADLVNQRQDRKGYGLNRLEVRNGDLTSHITADRIRDVIVNNGSALVDVTVTSDAVTLGRYEAFNRLGVRGGDLLAATIHLEPGTLMKTLEVSQARQTGGNVTGPVHVTANLGRAFVSNDVVVNSWEIGGDLGELKVNGLVRSAGGVSSIRTGGGIRKIELGSIQDVDILAGVSSAVGRKAANAADFVSLVAIEQFRIKGLPGPGPKPRFMTNSFVSAATFGTFKLLNADFPTSGLYLLDQGGAEIGRIVHKDTENPGDNFVFPPKPNQVFGGPAGFINLVV